MLSQVVDGKKPPSEEPKPGAYLSLHERVFFTRTKQMSAHELGQYCDLTPERLSAMQ